MNPKNSTKKPNHPTTNHPTTKHQTTKHQAIDHRTMILKSLETLKIKLAAQELDELVREATESGMSAW